MTDGIDFYDLLGVSPDARPEEVRRAFRERVREYHPDLNDDPRARAQFTALKTAYDTLADPTERDAYDRLGHETYVSERVSSLPSLDAWETPDEVSSDSSGVGRTDPRPARGSTGGRRRTDRTGRDRESPGSPRDAGDSRQTGWDGDPDPDPDADFEVDIDLGNTSAGSGVHSSSDATTGPDRESRADGFELGADGGSRRSAGLRDVVDPNDTPVDSSEVSKSPTASGAGTARGPKTAPTPGDPTRSRRSATDEYIGDAVGGTDPSVTDRVRAAAGWLLGWPLVVLADVLYLAVLGVYYLTSPDGFGRLFDRLAADPTIDVFASRYGIEGLPGVVARAATPSASMLSGVVTVLGVAALPSVYLLLVRWTRRNSQAWQPSYLYVLGASAPAVGMLLAALSPPSGILLDVVAYVAVPLLTMTAMVVFGQLLPRLRRLLRRLHYRLTN